MQQINLLTCQSGKYSRPSIYIHLGLEVMQIFMTTCCMEMISVFETKLTLVVLSPHLAEK